MNDKIKVVICKVVICFVAALAILFSVEWFIFFVVDVSTQQNTKVIDVVQYRDHNGVVVTATTVYNSTTGHCYLLTSGVYGHHSEVVDCLIDEADVQPSVP